MLCRVRHFTRAAIMQSLRAVMRYGWNNSAGFACGLAFTLGASVWLDDETQMDDDGTGWFGTNFLSTILSKLTRALSMRSLSPIPQPSLR
jgi:hypothetical protein